MSGKTKPMFPLSKEEEVRLAKELAKLEQEHQDLEIKYKAIQKKHQGKFADLKTRKMRVVKTLLGQDPNEGSADDEKEEPGE